MNDQAKYLEDSITIFKGWMELKHGKYTTLSWKDFKHESCNLQHSWDGNCQQS